MNESVSGASGRPGPLQGIRVVECGVSHAGPLAGAILGDLGADVIKVETLDGDPERLTALQNPPEFARPKWNLLVEMSNRNKRSVCLDILSTDGKAILASLVEKADIFITNLWQRTKPELEIDYASLSRINPRIIYVNISAFGPEGPLAEACGFDPTCQAVSGMAYLANIDEPSPLQGIPLDQLTAITASHGAITALLARERVGVGQEVDASLYGSALWLMHANVLQTSILNTEIDVSWDRLENSILRTTYVCGDGKWIIGTNHPEEKYWRRFCLAIGRGELADDGRYDTKQKRADTKAELIEELDKVILTRPRTEWLKSFREHGVLFAPINALQDVLEDEQAHVNEYVVNFHHRHLGDVKIPGYPVAFGANSSGTRTSAPDLGEHTVEVLAELGYTSSDVEGLRERQVIN